MPERTSESVLPGGHLGFATARFEDAAVASDEVAEMYREGQHKFPKESVHNLT